jgi:carbonic anhydrase
LTKVTCLDPRCVPEQYFGPGSIGAAVVRNAGGRASPDVVKSITVLRALMDVQTVMVVHHTDCGMSHLTEKEIREVAENNTPGVKLPEFKEGEVNYGTFKPEGFEEAIKFDVASLRKEPLLQGVEIYGFAMEIQDGKVRPLDF